MFSRRHPYLHFLLIFSSIVSVSAIVISLIVLMGIKYSTQDDIPDAEDKVGVVEVKGYIADPQDTIQDIRKYREDKSIKALLFE